MSNSIIAANIKHILQEISQFKQQVRLVAVSKTKPTSDIISAYEEGGQRHFGENYIQELIEKANDPQIREKCPQIKWHFIGSLQSNKISKLINQVPPSALYMLESLASEKHAEMINQCVTKRVVGDESDGVKLKVLVQVNTSGEANKGGCESFEETLKLVQFIRAECAAGLEFKGLMTIGAAEGDPKLDFQKLIEFRDRLSKELSIPVSEIELSMGMSSDYLIAAEMGSTNVRVGSKIFGERIKKNV